MRLLWFSLHSVYSFNGIFSTYYLNDLLLAFEWTFKWKGFLRFWNSFCKNIFKVKLKLNVCTILLIFFSFQILIFASYKYINLRQWRSGTIRSRTARISIQLEFSLFARVLMLGRKGVPLTFHSSLWVRKIFQTANLGASSVLSAQLVNWFLTPRCRSRLPVEISRLYRLR